MMREMSIVNFELVVNIWTLDFAYLTNSITRKSEIWNRTIFHGYLVLEFRYWKLRGGGTATKWNSLHSLQKKRKWLFYNLFVTQWKTLFWQIQKRWSHHSNYDEFPSFSAEVSLENLVLGQKLANTNTLSCDYLCYSIKT